MSIDGKPDVDYVTDFAERMEKQWASEGMQSVVDRRPYRPIYRSKPLALLTGAIKRQVRYCVPAWLGSIKTWTLI